MDKTPLIFLWRFGISMLDGIQSDVFQMISEIFLHYEYGDPKNGVAKWWGEGQQYQTMLSF